MCIRDSDIDRILRTIQLQTSSDNIKDYIDEKFTKLENTIKELQALVINNNVKEKITM